MINPSLVRGLSIFSAGADSDPLSRRLRAMNRRPKRSMVRPERGKNVWAVDDKQFVYEAALTNPGTGLYHGYPLPDTKHTGFRNHVRDEWNRRATRRIK